MGDRLVVMKGDRRRPSIVPTRVFALPSNFQGENSSKIRQTAYSLDHQT